MDFARKLFSHEIIFLHSISGSRVVDDIPDFTGSHTIHHSLTNNSSCLSFFYSVITHTMINGMVTETNRYAQQMIGNDPATSAKSIKWSNVTFLEMCAFLGLIILMGIVKKNNIKDYWSTDESTDTPYFRGVMPRDRFLMIMKYLHINDNTKASPPTDPKRDKLFKVRPFFDVLQKSFSSMCTPSENLAIDEAMIPWRGNLSFKVFNPLKPIKHGIKAYELCDSKTGYCYMIEIYTGKLSASSKGSTYDLCFRLMDPYLDLGHKLYLDNFYSSPVLFQDMFNRKTGCCGTLRTNRKGTPDKIKAAKKLKKGDHKEMYLTNGNLQVIKWQDKRPVSMLSTIHNADFVSVPVKGKPGETQLKPKAVIAYNKNMFAVDSSDQLHQYLAFVHRTLKWWKRLLFHLLGLALVNAYAAPGPSSLKC